MKEGVWRRGSGFGMRWGDDGGGGGGASGEKTGGRGDEGVSHK